MTDPRKPIDTPVENTDHLIEDRDASSRTVEIIDPLLDIAPDVDVNDRPDIMGDEGPVAESNPHNRTE